MSAIDRNIDALLADPLAPSRSATRAIAYVGLDIPEDLLAADGLFACHLPWRTGSSTPRADRWLESSFPGWGRSIVEDWAVGAFDFFECVVFTRGDDTSQRMYYYICELQRRGLVGGPEPLIFDVARIQRPSSVVWTIGAVQRLADALGLDEQSLFTGMQTANQRRSLFEAIRKARRTGGNIYERLARASLFQPIENLVADLKHSDQEVAGRIVLAGSSPPDHRLHCAVEDCGWSVVDEAYDRSLARLGPVIAVPSGDPAAAIGNHAHAAPLGPRSFVDRARVLAVLARESRANAVIIWLIEEDEALAWDLVAQRAALNAAGIPLLALTRRQWDCSDRPEDDIDQFLGGLQQ